MIAAPFMNADTLTVGWIIGTAIAACAIVAVLVALAVRDAKQARSRPYQDQGE